MAATDAIHQTYVMAPPPKRQRTTAAKAAPKPRARVKLADHPVAGTVAPDLIGGQGRETAEDIGEETVLRPKVPSTTTTTTAAAEASHTHPHVAVSPANYAAAKKTMASRSTNPVSSKFFDSVANPVRAAKGKQKAPANGKAGVDPPNDTAPSAIPAAHTDSGEDDPKSKPDPAAGTSSPGGAPADLLAQFKPRKQK
ncbi:hypothetical protein W97_05724 [Coniosporium apollinis CBS 100218]|uniref:Uncharacterized protein n=1 Tax=Coniosporium apollinis (strain CBS 100218) TaxID=1168221 RepID=R7YXD4_CONA1|nr:uncharacterized protein W97_05724 [Coniosporium apollinis CBS 100218]EON66331.1 hypothetical protein W97_05724 [Coniosporium apollinis CBS 100218]